MSVVQYFSFSGIPLPHSGLQASDVPECGLTLWASGPMKPRRDEENRQRVFRSIGISPENLASCSQVHSRVVRVADSAAAFADLPEGDGVITANRALVPCVTVADCMPIWIHDPKTGFFGVLHSGWKGTGILRTAVELAADEWGARAADIRIILGPHIRSCCYTVDDERAEYFTRAFGPSCVSLDQERRAAENRWPWRLSLAEANVNLALELGIERAHIHDSGVCTACDPRYGSSRREGEGSFTHMAAFIRVR